MPGAFVAGLFKVESSLAFIPVLYCDQLHCLHAVGIRFHLVVSAIAHRCECSVLHDHFFDRVRESCIPYSIQNYQHDQRLAFGVL